MYASAPCFVDLLAGHLGTHVLDEAEHSLHDSNVVCASEPCFVDLLAWLVGTHVPDEAEHSLHDANIVCASA